jgi:hypothetical protein
MIGRYEKWYFKKRETRGRLISSDCAKIQRSAKEGNLLTSNATSISKRTLLLHVINSENTAH